MFSFSRFSFDLIEWVASDVILARIERRRLARQEAASLIEQSGPEAFAAAQQVAELARQRGDAEATQLWLNVAAEIARRDAKRRR